MIYYLLWHPKTNRLVIDKAKLVGYEVQKKTDAGCWIEAKKKLGFELTALQQEMLDAKNNSNQVGRGPVRHVENAGTKLRSSDRQLQNRREAGSNIELDLQQVLREEGLLPDLRALGDSGAAA